MIDFSRIEPSIFLGSAPQNSVDVARLAKMKITAVLSLQSDADLSSHRIDWKKLQSAYEYSNIVAQRFPIIDFDEVDLGEKLPTPVKTLNQLLQVGHTVYVHCNAGICRAPATVLTYLCHYRSMERDEALSYLRQSRPQVHPYMTSVKLALDRLAVDEEKAG